MGVGWRLLLVPAGDGVDDVREVLLPHDRHENRSRRYPGLARFEDRIRACALITLLYLGRAELYSGSDRGSRLSARGGHDILLAIAAEARLDPGFSGHILHFMTVFDNRGASTSCSRPWRSRTRWPAARPS